MRVIAHNYRIMPECRERLLTVREEWGYCISVFNDSSNNIDKDQIHSKGVEVGRLRPTLHMCTFESLSEEAMKLGPGMDASIPTPHCMSRESTQARLGAKTRGRGETALLPI